MDLVTSRLTVLSFVIFACHCSSSTEPSRDADMCITKKRMKGSTYVFYPKREYPRDCQDVFDQCEGQSADGVYLIKPEDSPEGFEVYCNNSIDGGGWTVIQRRVDGSVDFYRSWTDFKEGFGLLKGEFWLGNDNMYYLTNQRRYELRIDLNNVNGEPYFAKYTLFRISDEGNKYRLVLGGYDTSSTAGSDAMRDNQNQYFTTFDMDNDGDDAYNTAILEQSAWWYARYAGFCRLNGLYNSRIEHQSIYWNMLPGGSSHVKYAEMKVRPRSLG